ncbi:hypothetical protein PRO82_000574 [Candidatus Protochlamydia amoebophila]|nr:hypothetical protein [Candidatus Protochlamydia amoebophila]
MERTLEKCHRLNQRWAIDFMSDSLISGKKIRMLPIVDVFSRECPSDCSGKLYVKLPIN